MQAKKGNFYPFSPAYLSEYGGLDESTNEEDEAVETESPEEIRHLEETDDDQSFAAAAVLQDRLYVVGLRETQSCYLAGFASVTTLTDNVVLDGYLSILNESNEVDRPLWTQAMKIWVNKGGNRSRTIVLPEGHPQRKKIRTAIKSLQEASTGTDPLLAFFLVEGVHETLRWHDVLLQMEDTAACRLSIGDLSLLQYHQPLLTAVLTRAVSGTTCLVATARGMTLRRVEVSRFPSAWQSVVSDVTKPPRRTLRVMVCGAKGVGKSTFLKFLINHCMFLLRKHPHRPLYVLDLDVGQPELSVPGNISLHRLTRPLLASASHLHLRQPAASVFLGDITSKHEPGLFLAAARSLFEEFLRRCSRRQHLHSHHHPQHDAGGDPATTTTTAATAVEEEAPFNLAAAYARQNDLPEHPLLLVNTDGFVRHLGADILAALVDLLSPTHVLHLHPPSTATAATSDAAVAASSSSSGGQRVREEKEQAAVGAAGTLQQMLAALLATESDAGGPPRGELLSVAAGVARPLRSIAAPELRHLRFCAYFLRGAFSRHVDARALYVPPHVAHHRHSAAAASNAALFAGVAGRRAFHFATGRFIGDSDSDGDDDSDDAATREAERTAMIATMGRALQVKNAVVQDPRQSAVLAHALLQTTPIVVPLDRVVLQHVAEEHCVTPALSLAAANTRLVGVTLLAPPSTATATATAAVALTSSDAVAPHVRQVTLRSATGDAATDEDAAIRFGLLPPLSQSRVLLPTTAVGLVRAIDVATRSLYLLCPALLTQLLDAAPAAFDGNDSSGGWRVVLTVAAPSLALPPLLTHSAATGGGHDTALAAWPALPYTTASDAIAGEGHAMLKPRANLKRRPPSGAATAATSTAAKRSRA